jgi:transaldolase/transaldolase/glucose-6-phosphate isomerase
MKTLRHFPSKKSSIEEVFLGLEVKDIKRAADFFKPVYERTNGMDGFVSLEVSPRLAHDTEGTIKQARELWKAVSRKNVMIKIPSTAEGLPAIRKCISEGININITLLLVYRATDKLPMHTFLDWRIGSRRINPSIKLLQ